MNNKKFYQVQKCYLNTVKETGLNSLKELEPQNINDAYKIQNELKVEYF